MSGDRQRGGFVDTNILIYAFDATAGDQRRFASELVSRQWMDRQGCLRPERSSWNPSKLRCR